VNHVLLAADSRQQLSTTHVSERSEALLGTGESLALLLRVLLPREPLFLLSLVIAV